MDRPKVPGIYFTIPTLHFRHRK